jgi:hypothetical protein
VRVALSCLATLAASASLLLVPQASQASGGISFQPFYEFTVAFSGHGSYTRTVSSEGGGTLSEEASFKWQSVYAHVLVPTTRSSPLAGASFPAIGLGQEASGNWEITNTGAGEEDCSNSGTLGLPKDAPDGGGGGALTVKRPAGGAKGVIFNMYALSEYETTSGAGDGVLPCDPESWWHSIIEGFAGVGFKHSQAGLPDVKALTAKITLAPSDLKHASVKKSVSVGPAEMVSSDCGSANGTTCKQDYTWSGVVTFTKHKL